MSEIRIVEDVAFYMGYVCKRNCTSVGKNEQTIRRVYFLNLPADLFVTSSML